MIERKRFSCSDNEFIILGLMELLKKNKLIGESNIFGGLDELLFHSGGPVSKKSSKSIIIGPPKFRFLAKQPSREKLPTNKIQIDPLKGKLILGPAPPNLIWEVEKWEIEKWIFHDSIGGATLSKSLQKLEKFLPNNDIAPGTICGAFAYDLCQWTQPLRLINPPNENSLIGILFSIDRWIIHDRENKFIEIGAEVGDIWFNEVINLIKSIINLNEIQPDWPKNSPKFVPEEYSNFTDSEHTNIIERVQESIKSGELYQLNFGRKWKGPLMEDPWILQLRLAKINPAPWSCYIYSKDLGFCLCSSSPEILIQGDGQEFYTSPIKGTKPRGKTKSKDLKLINDLINCSKERAEHLMLVDLEKNDLTKFCKLGSVRRESFQVESFAQVHHLVSDIKGKISDMSDIWKSLEFMFPGGSISGCPKTVTIASIDQIEGEARSFWTGSAGIINHNNNSLSLNILIRTLEGHKINSKWEGVIQAGGGLVIGSKPNLEVEEAKLKAQALRKIVGWIEGDMDEKYPSKSLSNFIINKKNYENNNKKNIGKYTIWPSKLDNSEKMIAFIDNLDSFSWNIVNELAKNGANVCVIPGRENSPTFNEIMSELSPSHIILGPGPGNPNVSKLSIEISLNALEGKSPPLLGICLGHQAIGAAAGWEICKTPTGAIHGEVHQIEDLGSSLTNLEKKMTRYHSLTLVEPKLNNSGLKVVAKIKNESESVMAIEHNEFLIFGVQFHPESEESQGDGEIFKNFLNC